MTEIEKTRFVVDCLGAYLRGYFMAKEDKPADEISSQLIKEIQDKLNNLESQEAAE